MERSEIVAWQLGLDIEREVREGDNRASDPGRLDWQALTIEQQESRFALGDAMFAYWVLRGSQDALNEHHQ